MSLEGLSLQLGQQFEVVVCCNCRCLFAVPAAVRRKWVESGESFHCPAGHTQHYTESDVQKLQKQLAQAQRERDWARSNASAERSARERTERRLSARKGVNTRLRNRIKNGVCPCCSRTFLNLQDHMKTKHPEFQADDGAL